MFPEPMPNDVLINHDFFFHIHIILCVFGYTMNFFVHNSFPTNLTLNPLSLKTESHVAHAAACLLYIILHLYVQRFNVMIIILSFIAFSKIMRKMVAYGDRHDPHSFHRDLYITCCSSIELYNINLAVQPGFIRGKNEQT